MAIAEIMFPIEKIIKKEMPKIIYNELEFFNKTKLLYEGKIETGMKLDEYWLKEHYLPLDYDFWIRKND